MTGSAALHGPAAAARDPRFDLAGMPPARGAAATWQRLLRLSTTASVLQTTAHPDDEQGPLLAWLAHSRGVRTALPTLNRGEAGDNALGPALFDALGLLRTEELRAAGQYYGLDAQYYTMVPTAIAQLGASIVLLGPDDLATGDLGRFDTIVTGTRAYAVRADLRAHNQRLLEYVKAGGNFVVLYNTPELVPRDHSPFPAELRADAEEVCEERAAVELLQPEHPLLATPSRITAADFDGWIEQRGSKFFSSWDAAYTPLLSSHDRGQPAQHGGMLHARYGRGHYTYMAYALHRQLPAGVPGAYRLLANLLSLGRGRPQR